MTRAQAIEVYFKRNKRAASTLKKITRWENHKTIEVNSNILKTTWAYSRSLAHYYKLSYKKPKPKPHNEKRMRKNTIEKLKKLGYTYRQIGRLHGVSGQRIWEIKHS